jgi:hypothetical protein
MKRDQSTFIVASQNLSYNQLSGREVEGDIVGVVKHSVAT